MASHDERCVGERPALRAVALERAVTGGGHFRHFAIGYVVNLGSWKQRCSVGCRAWLMSRHVGNAQSSFRKIALFGPRLQLVTYSPALRLQLCGDSDSGAACEPFSPSRFPRRTLQMV